ILALSVYHTHTHTHTRTHTHTHTHTHRHTDTQTHRWGASVLPYVFPLAETQKYTPTSQHPLTRAHTHTGARTHKHVPTFKDTHTPTHTNIYGCDRSKSGRRRRGTNCRCR